MPRFVLVCQDKPASLPLRMATRESHLAYIATQSDKIRSGGPILDDKGDMAGSWIVVEVASRAEAEAFSAADPYSKAGLFAQVQILQFRPSLGAPA
jgi:uncharacterized protein